MVLAQRAPDCDYLYKTVSQVRTDDSILLLSTSALRLPISVGPLLLILSDQTVVWKSEADVILGFLTRRQRDGHSLERPRRYRSRATCISGTVPSICYEQCLAGLESDIPIGHFVTTGTNVMCFSCYHGSSLESRLQLMAWVPKVSVVDRRLKAVGHSAQVGLRRTPRTVNSNLRQCHAS